MEEVIKKQWVILWFVILILGIFLRVYRLSEVPNGLYQDETAIGYNAYSILKTGKDEYAKPYPLYFKSFGDYKLPVYIYLTTIPVQFLGLVDVAPRVVSSFFSILTVGMIFFFVRRLTKRTSLALISMFVIAVNPWHLQYGRATFEVSVVLFFFMAGTWLLLSKKLSLVSAIMGLLCFVIALYSYNLTRLLAPLLLLLIIYYRKEDFVRKSKVFKGALAGIFLICLLPFLLTLLDPEGLSSAKGTLIHSSAAVQVKLLELRSYMIYTPTLFQKIFFSSYPQTLWEYIKHILSYLSVDFFFISGSPHGNHGIGNFGLFYPIEIVTIITGITVGFMKKERWIYLLLIWAIIVIMVAAITREAPHATRSFFLIMPYVVFSAYGFLQIVLSLKSKKAVLRIIIGTCFILITGYGFIYYFTSYYTRFPVAYASKWNSEDKEVVDYINKHGSQYKRIIVDSNTSLIYTSILYYMKYDPEDFQKTVKRAPDDSEGFSKVESFGKFQFRKIDWNLDSKLTKTLFITSADNIPDEKMVIEKLSYPQRPAVINIGQQIYQFPVTDSAYVLLEKN